MKTISTYILLALLLASCEYEESTSVINVDSEDTQSEQIDTVIKDTNELFNAELAEELGADDYGMHKYVLAYLKVGPNRTQSKEEAEKLQRAHLDNIVRLANEGVLVLAGPFLDDGDVRGIYIFNVETIEEAEKLTLTDPAIQSGSLVMELHPWYGSAALMKLNEIHAQIAKINI